MVKLNDFKKIIKKVGTIDEMLTVKSDVDAIVKDRLKELGHIDKSNTVLQFLCEVIYPGDNKEIHSPEIYEMYKKWCKDEITNKPFGKNKFYEMLKLEPRVTHKHLSIGDYFIIKLNPKAEKFKIPF